MTDQIRNRLTPGQDAAISLDIAASQFGKNGRYTLSRDKRDLILKWIAAGAP